MQLIHENCAPLQNCIGFIDCTKIAMVLPGGPASNQRSFYNGHKRYHCLIYQTISTPDPEVGRRHDLTLYRQSNLDEELRESLIEMLGEENLPRNTYYGDGTPIDVEALNIIREVYKKTKVSFDWEENDLLLLDNMLYTHGREPYEGTRKVLVGLAGEYSLS